MTPRYGGVVSRGLAVVVDAFVLGALIAGTTWIVPQLAHHFLGIPIDPARCGSTEDWWQVRKHLCRALDWVTPVVALSFGPLYRVGFWALSGQTPGMALLGLRVLRTDGRPIGLRIAFQRWALRLASIFALGLGFLPVLLNARRQAFHDRFSRTVVVHEWVPRREATGLTTSTDAA